MSKRFSKDTERMRRKQSQNMKKYQKKQMRHYLKNIRFRMNRKRRWIFYGLVAAAFVYLAGVWQLRDCIWSIREMEEIEYQIPDWTGNEGGRGTSTRIRLHLKTGELEILHEWTESGENGADYRRKALLEPKVP